MTNSKRLAAIEDDMDDTPPAKRHRQEEASPPVPVVRPLVGVPVENPDAMLREWLLQAERGLSRQLHWRRRNIVDCMRSYMVDLRNTWRTCGSGTLLAIDIFDRFMAVDMVEGTERLRAVAGAALLLACKMVHVRMPDKEEILDMVGTSWDDILAAEGDILRALGFRLSLPTAEDAVHVLHHTETDECKERAVRLAELYAETDEYVDIQPSELAAAAVTAAGGNGDGEPALVAMLASHARAIPDTDYAMVMGDHAATFPVEAVGAGCQVERVTEHTPDMNVPVDVAAAVVAGI